MSTLSPSDITREARTLERVARCSFAESVRALEACGGDIERAFAALAESYSPAVRRDGRRRLNQVLAARRRAVVTTSHRTAGQSYVITQHVEPGAHLTQLSADDVWVTAVCEMTFRSPEGEPRSQMRVAVVAATRDGARA